MSLTSIFHSSSQGLDSVQRRLELTAGNIGAASTGSPSRKDVQIVSNELGVRKHIVTRNVDYLLERRLHVERAEGRYLNILAETGDRIDHVLGRLEDGGGVHHRFQALMGAIQDLTANPASAASRRNVVDMARFMANDLNRRSEALSDLRQNAEDRLAASAQRADDLMAEIARLNRNIAIHETTGSAVALEDRRDEAIGELSSLIDIRTEKRRDGYIAVHTGSGLSLVEKHAATLSFDRNHNVRPESLWSPDAERRTLRSLILTPVGGGDIDLNASGHLRSGELSALTKIRDDILTAAQRQLDVFADAVSRATAGYDVIAAVESSGAHALDAGVLRNGDRVIVKATGTGGVDLSVAFIHEDGAIGSQLDSSALPGHGGAIYSLDFNASDADLGAVLAPLLPAGIAFSRSADGKLIFTPSSGSSSVLVSVVAQRMATDFSSHSQARPFFTDRAPPVPYAGRVGEGIDQLIGYAGRIGVNAELIADPALLQGSGGSADPRPALNMLSRLKDAVFDYRPDGAENGEKTAFKGSLSDYLRKAAVDQSDRSASFAHRAEAQQGVVQTLEQKRNDKTGVDLDRELAHLLVLQNAYAANARVMTTVREIWAILNNI